MIKKSTQPYLMSFLCKICCAHYSLITFIFDQILKYFQLLLLNFVFQILFESIKRDIILGSSACIFLKFYLRNLYWYLLHSLTTEDCSCRFIIAKVLCKKGSTYYSCQFFSFFVQKYGFTLSIYKLCDYITTRKRYQGVQSIITTLTRLMYPPGR